VRGASHASPLARGPGLVRGPVIPRLVPLAQVGHDLIRLVRSSPCVSAIGMRVVAVLLHEGLDGMVRSTDGLGWPSRGCYGPHLRRLLLGH
jgi:hypothetical protein